MSGVFVREYGKRGSACAEPLLPSLAGPGAGLKEKRITEAGNNFCDEIREGKFGNFSLMRRFFNLGEWNFCHITERDIQV